MNNVVIGLAAAMLAQAAGAQTVPNSFLDRPSPPPVAPASTAAADGQARPPVPAGNPGSWVTNSDYPARALRENREGLVSFRLAVGADGRVQGCTILASSGSPDLDAATCQLMTTRAQFRPGLDSDGHPQSGTWASKVRWKIPAGAPTSIVPESKVITFVLEADGTASHCKAMHNGKVDTDPAIRTPCSAGDRFQPFINAKGQPVRKLVTISYALTVSNAP